MVVVAILAWYVLEHTPVGRFLYATGGAPEAARLAGLPTKRLIFGAFVICGLVAGFAGLLATAQFGAGSPDIGPPYLLSAFAAAFLGSTQLKHGRVNIWGAVIAVYVLAIGVKGLQLAGAPFWVSELFNGLALIVAVAAAVHERKTFRGGRLRKRPGGAAAAAKTDKSQALDNRPEPA
jgi:ribose transport system permease protein